MVKLKVRAPKGFKIRGVSLSSGQKVGHTTVKLKLKKGRINIPFPKVAHFKGSYKSSGGGMDAKGEYELISKTKKF